MIASELGGDEPEFVKAPILDLAEARQAAVRGHLLQPYALGIDQRLLAQWLPRMACQALLDRVRARRATSTSPSVSASR